MTIQLEGIGKRFLYDWIFRNIDLSFSVGAYAILGHNGSGKSTLMKVLSGQLTPSAGKILFTDAAQQQLDNDLIYKSISYAAPYIELIEEFTLEEHLLFHNQFKPFYAGLSIEAVKDILKLAGTKGKFIKYYSSGMKQRLKLALACCSDTPILLLDEPTTNLDRQGVDWYQALVSGYAKDRIAIVASNVEADYFFCTDKVYLPDYKKK